MRIIALLSVFTLFGCSADATDAAADVYTCTAEGPILTIAGIAAHVEPTGDDAADMSTAEDVARERYAVVAAVKLSDVPHEPGEEVAYLVTCVRQ